jgi:outer membrane protein assembly factor BamB
MWTRWLRPSRSAVVWAAALVVAWGVAASARAAAPTAKRAREILGATGVRGGLVLHLGCGDGALTAALHANERYLVQGLAADAKAVDAARKRIREQGLYGPVSVIRLRGKRLPYTDNLVNLVVAETGGAVPASEIDRVLAPGGVAYVRRGGEWTKRVKPWPDEIDDWTHYLHGPDNNATAMDTRVGPPRHLKWKSDPLWCRSHDGVPSSVAVVLSARGRLFSIIDEGLTGQPGLPQRWTLVARDGFNGTLLWKKELPGRLPRKCLAAVGERLYFTGARRDPLTILDAATGETLQTCDGTKKCDEVVCNGEVAVVHLRGMRKSKDGKDDSIVAVDAQSGKPRWERPSKHIVRDTLALADGRVYYHTGAEAVCLELASGKERWRTACKAGRRGGALMVYQGAVLCAGSGGLQGFDAKTGKPLWKGPRVHGRLGMFGASGLVWLSDIQERGRTFLWTPAPVVAKGYHPTTGEVKRTVKVDRLITPGHHIRCYPAKATDRYLMLPKRGVEFVDLRGENHMRHDWLRAPCGHGVIAANGLLYTPPHQCFCYPGVRLTGYNALAAEVSEAPAAEAQRRVQGAAYGKPVEAAQGTADWPMYRHDPLRSGRADCSVPAKLKPLWQRDLAAPLAQPVVAGGRLLMAEKDAHTIHCLDAATGEPQWSHTAGARIDSSPTCHQGRVLFGSTDGWVHCLRAADGALIWRFRAAPEERRIVAFNQLESPWPVHGSVIVQDGKVYCTAGRSSYLDGGIWVYALDPATGKVLHERHLASERPDVTKQAGRPFDMEGARTDLLVSDGTDLYMFFTRLAPDLSRKEAPRITKLGDRRVTPHLMSNAGFLDTSWFDRNYWTYGDRWPGYYFAYNAAKSGQILCFDEQRTYGLHVFTTRQGHSPRFWPGRDGYELFADSNKNRLALRPTAIGREKGTGYSRALPPLWSVKIPVRVQGLVLAGERLFAAGTPDVLPKEDPYAGIEGRKGGRLWVVSTNEGERLAEYELDHPPAFDGLIAAAGRLYLATEGGRVVCMGESK